MEVGLECTTKYFSYYYYYYYSFAPPYLKFPFQPNEYRYETYLELGLLFKP
jgi:hypothetical protein